MDFTKNENMRLIGEAVVKLESSHTMIRPPTVSVLWIVASVKHVWKFRSIFVRKCKNSKTGLWRKPSSQREWLLHLWPTFESRWSVGTVSIVYNCLKIIRKKQIEAEFTSWKHKLKCNFYFQIFAALLFVVFTAAYPQGPG